MASTARPAVAGVIDDLLFEPSGWFAIGADNLRVPRVVVATREAGLAMIGMGPVATIVGRLRPEVSVVDVDLAGHDGDAAAELLTRWCLRTGVWHLVRPSGGGPGRYHVFIALPRTDPDLVDVVDQLRVDLAASRTQLDLRTPVRPLTAPHRLGAHPGPQGAAEELRAATMALHGLLGPVSSAGGPTGHPTPASATQDRLPLTPPLPPGRPRPRKALAASWAGYLEDGVAPPVAGQRQGCTAVAHGRCGRCGSDHSRSTIEAIATKHLLHCGHDATSAWALIRAAHPAAMTKARDNKDRWITLVWNRAVQEDLAYSPALEVDADVDAAVAAARGRLPSLARTLPPRRRPALLAVAHQILDRALRTNSRRVPVPERDLVLDTGLSDRKTIRAALRRLDGRLGDLHTDAWTPVRREETSFEYELPSAPTPPAPLDETGLLQIPPPRSHTPQSPPVRYVPPGVWSVLGLTAHAVWRTLSTEPASVEDLLARTGLTDPAVPPSAGQTRTATETLTVLARAGLAACTVEGTWTAATGPYSADVLARADRAHRAATAAIAAERATYRAASSTTWSSARTRALKAQIAREHAWWDGLEPAEQLERRARWRATFDALPLIEKEQLTNRLARRRVDAGIDERARHAAWTAAQDPETARRRSLDRQAAYARLPEPLQHAHVAAWQRHRDTYGIPTRPGDPENTDAGGSRTIAGHARPRDPILHHLC